MPFVRLLHGNRRVILVNCNCYNIHLIQYVKEKCEIPENVLLDICDEQGTLLRLPEKDPWLNLNDTFPVSDDPEQIFIPVAIKTSARDGMRRYWAVVDDLAEILPECQEQIEAEAAAYNAKVTKNKLHKPDPGSAKTKRSKSTSGSPTKGKSAKQTTKSGKK